METNHNEALQNELPDILEPINIIVSEIKNAPQEIPVPAGYVFITALDAEGNEIKNNSFFYPEKSYKRFFGDETRYHIIKSSLTIHNSINHENFNRTSQQIISRTTGGCTSCGR